MHTEDRHLKRIKIPNEAHVRKHHIEWKQTLHDSRGQTFRWQKNKGVFT